MRAILGPPDPRPGLVATIVFDVIAVAARIAIFVRLRALEALGADVPYSAFIVLAAVSAGVQVAGFVAASATRLGAFRPVFAFIVAAGAATSCAWAYVLGPHNIELWLFP